jgi:hypothetical protein
LRTAPAVGAGSRRRRDQSPEHEGREGMKINALAARRASRVDPLIALRIE